MAVLKNFPTIRPSLLLDFARTRSLDPRVTFTRVMTGASVATFVGADGLIKTAGNNVPRFDHNPATGESLGLLVEEARTNSITYSEQLNNGAWTKNNVTISANATTAPDGTSTADQASNTPNQFSWLRPSVSISSSTTYTFSLYVKPLTTNKIMVLETGAGNLTFNLSTLTTSGSGGSAQILTISNGWYRIIFTFTGITQFPAIFLGPYAVTADNVTFAFWGAQVEAGSFPTSYIPTSGSTVTRAADVATVSNTGSSIFPTSAFTTVNSPFGTAGGGSTVKLVGPTIKRTAIYDGDLPQAQINALAGVNDGFWRWRVLGSSFALPNFTTDGSVTVDWGDGTVQTLTTAVRTFANGGGYHDIGFRLDSGTFFRPNINANGTYAPRVIAVGPAPASMKLDPARGFYGCTAFRSFDATVDTIGRTDFSFACQNCSSLTSFPLINTAASTSFYQTWYGCSSLTSFPLINTAAGTDFRYAWYGCTSLASFPALNFANATTFNAAWLNSYALAAFPANMFNTTGTLVATAFTNAFSACALTAASIENILTSLVTNGQSNITLTLSGGTNAGASTWTTAANTAYATLISRDWTINRNP